MSRSMTPAAEAALVAQGVRPVIFWEGEFASGFLRLWTGLGDVSWNGQTWTGAGNLIGIGSIEEGSSVTATGTVVTIAGVPAAHVSAAITDAMQGKPGRLWVGVLDAAGAIIADPVMAFEGRLDVPDIQDGRDTVTITIAYESRLIDLNRERAFRYTDESHRTRFPMDRAFRFVTGIQEKKIKW